MNRTILALLTGFAISTISGCDNSSQATGTSDDTHSSILLTGRVFTDQSRPLGAVIVHLRHAGLSDTTDGDGRFTLRGTGATPNAIGEIALDSIDYLRDGSLVHSSGVTSWIDTLPDVFLVQRDISGSISLGWTVLSGSGISSEAPAEAIPVHSTSALLWNATGDSMPFDLEWNSESQRYSGFVWFRYTGGLDSFKVQVKALDSLGHIIGISQKLTFTSRAGDIQIPSFLGRNTIPVVALKSSETLVRGKASRIFALVSNPYDYPTTIWWKIGSGDWTPGSSDTLLNIAKDLSGSILPIRCKVVRPDSLYTMAFIKIPLSDD